MPDNQPLSIGLVPPRRLGSLLAGARSERGLTLDEVADATTGRFSRAALASIERGSIDVSDDDVKYLADTYGLATATLIPERSHLELDVAEGVLRTQVGVERFDPMSASPDDVLPRYLAMVYSMRHAGEGSKVSLRQEDLEVLGTALHIGVNRIEADLVALMDRPTASVGRHLSSVTRRILIPAAGVMVAFCGVGALILAQGESPKDLPVPTAPDSTLAPAPAVDPGADVTSEVDVGTGAVQERDAGGGATPVEQRDEPTPP